MTVVVPSEPPGGEPAAGGGDAPAERADDAGPEGGRRDRRQPGPGHREVRGPCLLCVFTYSELQRYFVRYETGWEINRF